MKPAWLGPLCLATSLFSVACGASNPDESPAGITALYAAVDESELTPYPSNRYTVADSVSPTGLRLDLSNSGTTDLLSEDAVTLAELDALDGFSIHGGVILSLDGRPEVSGLARIGAVPDVDFIDEVGAARDAAEFTGRDSPLLLLDVDPKSPERGQARGLVVSYWEHDGEADGGESEFTLIAQPARPLRPRTRYLFVATNSLRGEGGESVGPSEATRQLLAGESEGAYGQEVVAGLEVLTETLGLEVEAVVLATSFTTASVHDEMLAAASLQRSAPMPALIEPWTVERPVSDDGRMRLRAVISSPAYRGDDERFVVKDGVPQVVGTEEIEVFLAVSDSDQSSPRPVVIYGHGLSGDKDGSWGSAQRLSKLGAAVFAIDAPHHGTRGGDTVNAVTSTTKFFGIDTDDRSFVIGRARDNFRQMALDQLNLVRFIGTLDEVDVLPFGAPDGKPDFDTTKILYLGQSFGAVQGGTVFALAPEIKHAVWNVGGAGLMTLIRDSKLFTLVLSALRPPEMTDASLARFLAVTQAIIDPGDPLSFAPHGTGENLVEGGEPRDVLLQEVIDDNTVPNTSTRALARAAGLQLFQPVVEVSGMSEVSGGVVKGNLPSGATGVMTQFAVMNGDEAANHGGLFFAEEGRAQYIEFFQTGLDSGRASISGSR